MLSLCPGESLKHIVWNVSCSEKICLRVSVRSDINRPVQPLNMLKPDGVATEDGWGLKILDLRRRGIILFM